MRIIISSTYAVRVGGRAFGPLRRLRVRRRSGARPAQTPRTIASHGGVARVPGLRARHPGRAARVWQMCPHWIALRLRRSLLGRVIPRLRCGALVLHNRADVRAQARIAPTGRSHQQRVAAERVCARAADRALRLPYRSRLPGGLVVRAGRSRRGSLLPGRYGLRLDPREWRLRGRRRACARSGPDEHRSGCRDSAAAPQADATCSRQRRVVSTPTCSG